MYNPLTGLIKGNQIIKPDNNFKPSKPASDLTIMPTQDGKIKKSQIKNTLESIAKICINNNISSFLSGLTADQPRVFYSNPNINTGKSASLYFNDNFIAFSPSDGGTTYFTD